MRYRKGGKEKSRRERGGALIRKKTELRERESQRRTVVLLILDRKGVEGVWEVCSSTRMMGRCAKKKGGGGGGLKIGMCHTIKHGSEKYFAQK